MNYTYMIAACLIGMAFATQPAINAVAAKTLESVFAATVLSVGITLIVSAIIMLWGRSTPTWEMVSNLPLWIVLGGLIGVLVVSGGAMIVPVTGAAVFFVCLIAGQLLGSVLLDQSGLFGMDIRTISPLRILGVALTFAGVFCVRYG